MSLEQYTLTSGINSPEMVFRSGWVVVSSSKVLRNGFVRVRGGRVIEAGSASEFKDRAGVINVDAGPGVIFPGVINAHTHLELSFLKGKLDTSLGFRKWVNDLISLRSAESADNILNAARQALSLSALSGTAYLGDISTLGLSSSIFSSHYASGTGFHEYLGKQDGSTITGLPADSDNHIFSYAAHAPHTTSPELVASLKKKASSVKRPLSIHLDESEDEREFITKGKGDWADFLTARGIDFSNWGLPSESPVVFLDRTGILDSGTLCVHVCGSSKKDLQILKDRGAGVCICPRSNMNLHGILPDICSMLAIDMRPCIGTDSLASVESLSVFDEIRFLAEKFPQINSLILFRIATEYGADALSVGGQFGSLEPGKRAFLVYSGMVPNKASDVFDSFVFSRNIEVL